ncbi:DNA methyltransferase [Corynebacterium variabile]|uniref:DNA methyltransferase n=1 Tax=Corynebacterium variabile TaxID=1727 RepID=UPI003FCF8851
MLRDTLRSYAEIPFGTDIPQANLDIEGGRRVNSLPWRGQFSPGLVEVLLDTYAPEGGLVLDPFCGSGTTMIEAARTGRPSHGVEVNPAAYILARLYSLGNTGQEPLVAFENVRGRVWSTPGAFDDATALLGAVKGAATDAETFIAEAVFLLALKNGDTVSEKKLTAAIDHVGKLMMQVSDNHAPVSIQLGDSRHVDLPDASADAVLTSPPYVNVFNYHQNYRKAVEMLGWEVLPAARAEFGSNRKHRQNRFLTVTQYAQDMGETIAESIRLVKPGGTSVWVVGRESNVRGCAIPNPDIVHDMATGVGIDLAAKYERKFRSRYGALVYEDIMVFTHPEDAKARAAAVNITELGRAIGSSVLGGLAPTDPVIVAEVAEAITKSENIEPSPSPSHNQS